jgi:hypothetical protein
MNLLKIVNFKSMDITRCNNCNKKSFEKGSWYNKNREKKVGEGEFPPPQGLLYEVCFNDLDIKNQEKWQFLNNNM